MIALGASPSPNAHVQAAAKATFAKAFLSVTNIIFAYAGHVAFFSFISELRDPKTFPLALFVLQGTDTLMYIIVGVVVYRYAGANVESPALGSTGKVVRKVAYGIALPTVSLPIPNPKSRLVAIFLTL
jgi:amino acid permease